MTTEIIEKENSAPAKKQTALITALNWLYDQVSGTQKTSDLAKRHLSDEEIDRRIAYYCAMAGTVGFASNLGGILTLPVALPANLLSVAALQLRLVAEIASARGYDLHGPEVRVLAITCLTGNAAFDIIKDAGIQFGVKVGQRAISQITGATILKINQAVGFRLLTKAGTQGVVNLTKFVPVVGGIVGGTVDALSTKAVGEIARRVFKAPLLNEGPGYDPNIHYGPDEPHSFTYKRQ